MLRALEQDQSGEESPKTNKAYLRVSYSTLWFRNCFCFLDWKCLKETWEPEAHALHDDPLARQAVRSSSESSLNRRSEKKIVSLREAILTWKDQWTTSADIITNVSEINSSPSSYTECKLSAKLMTQLAKND